MDRRADMGGTKTLLISETSPEPHYGDGQRMMLWKDIFARLGECRFVKLTTAAVGQGGAAATLPHPFDWRAPRWKWIARQLSFAEYRPDHRYGAMIEALHRDFPFDLVMCVLFQATPTMPTGRYPCILDVDIAPRPTSRTQRLIWPLARAMVRRRAADFDQLYVIRAQDAAIVAPKGEAPVRLIPGLSMTARTTPDSADTRSGALLVGSMRWEPNRRAVETLIRIGVPAALAARGAALTLVGEDTTMFAGVPGVEALGFVDDLNAVYARAAVVLCPITGLHGANIKLAEAVQSGCAVLASEDAAAAYTPLLVAGRDLATYGAPEAALPALLALLDDPRRLAGLRAAARARAVDALSADAYAAMVADDVARIMAARAGRVGGRAPRLAAAAIAR